ncbi:MAG: RHS repeat-associated core domain-containing protein [Verrucomicrobia bacterium]|nr:RHS repeat-associated core domain-containing protein [Verrucomicrobiota bacterium]
MEKSNRKIEFKYDWMGRRIQKEMSSGYPRYWDSEYTNKFVYDLSGGQAGSWNLLAELNGSNDVVRSYMWGLDMSGTLQGAGGVGGLLGVNDANQGFHFVAYDGNGNVMALVDADDGTVSAEYEYGPFGELIRATGPMSDNPIRFSTKYHDTETGLVYYGYRYYWPAMGRWIKRDPIGERGGMNLYNYVGNDPLNWIDTLGLAYGNPISGPNGPVGPSSPYSPGLPYYPDGYLYTPTTSNYSTSYVEEEQHFIIGSGFTRVFCCDENYNKRIFWYRKICFGAAVGFCSGGGKIVSGMSGKDCRGQNYEGWVFEGGVSLGPVGIGGDVGYQDFPGTQDWLLPPPGDYSGVNEFGFGAGMGLPKPGLMVKATWCRYTLFYEKRVPCGCVK